MEGEDNNFTSGSEAEGNESTEACSHEKRLVAFGVPIVDFLAGKCHRTPAEERELHLVGVTAEGKLGSTVGDNLTPPG